MPLVENMKSAPECAIYRQSLLHASGSQIIVTGRQNDRDGDVGIGIFFNPVLYHPPERVATHDGSNHGIVANRKLRAGNTVALDYSVAGAWSGSGDRGSAAASVRRRQGDCRENRS